VKKLQWFFISYLVVAIFYKQPQPMYLVFEALYLYISQLHTSQLFLLDSGFTIYQTNN